LIERILVIGVSGRVAEATARLYAERGAQLFLIAPDAGRVEAIAADLRVRGAQTALAAGVDLGEPERLAQIVTEADAALGGIDLAVLAIDAPPEPEGDQDTAASIRTVFETGCLGPLGVLTRLAALLERRGQGRLAVLSSVAGERGRRQDFAHGAAAAAVNVFLQGLRGRLAGAGVQVLTVKLGGPARDPAAGALPRLLEVSPRKAARRIVQAADRRREVIYVPATWGAITWLLHLLPEKLLKRLPY